MQTIGPNSLFTLNNDSIFFSDFLAKSSETRKPEILWILCLGTKKNSETRANVRQFYLFMRYRSEIEGLIPPGYKKIFI